MHKYDSRVVSIVIHILSKVVVGDVDGAVDSAWERFLWVDSKLISDGGQSILGPAGNCVDAVRGQRSLSMLEMH